MENFFAYLRSYFSRKEIRLLGLLFITLLGYLIARSVLIFYAHDELVTKWAYCLNWNYLPHQGYFDANNHFLFSFLSGLFIRLFSSEHLLVFRLPSILAFVLYFVSVISLRPFFKNPYGFYLAVSALVGSHFIFDFFNMGRGYALAWAFLLAAISAMLYYYRNGKILPLILAFIFSLLGMFANLSITPFVIILLLFVPTLSFLFSNEKKRSLLPMGILYILAIYPFYYLIQYTFELQESGKLYLGNESDFWATTVYPLLDFNFGLSERFSFLLCVVFIVLFLKALWKQNWKICKPTIFSLVLFLCILLHLSIIAQNVLMGINFPEDRAIGHLLLILLMTLAFSIDQLQKKRLAYLFITFFGVSFFLKTNLHDSQVYRFEQFDKRLLTSIPDTVKGIPPATAGKHWVMPNAMSREGYFPAKAFQTVTSSRDTLHDFILALAIDSNKYNTQYDVFQLDKKSGTAVLKRKKPLGRQLIQTFNTQVNGNDEYYNLTENITKKGLFVRLSGTIYQASINVPYIILLTQEEVESKKRLMYVGIDPVSACPINEHGEIQFDVTFSVLDYHKEANSLLFIYNPKRNKLKGNFKVELYEAG